MSITSIILFHTVNSLCRNVADSALCLEVVNKSVLHLDRQCARMCGLCRPNRKWQVSTESDPSDDNQRAGKIPSTFTLLSRVHACPSLQGHQSATEKNGVPSSCFYSSKLLYSNPPDLWTQLLHFFLMNNSDYEIASQSLCLPLTVLHARPLETRCVLQHQSENVASLRNTV
jgi:hypothetical protein